MGANLGNFVAIPIALLFGIVSMSEFKEIQKQTATYQFDMNNDAEFRDDLMRFFSNEIMLNDSAKKMEIGSMIPFLIHCDKNGNIINVECDTIQANESNFKYHGLRLEEDALNTLRKLPKFIPRKGMTNDTIIKEKFYVYHTNK